MNNSARNLQMKEVILYIFLIGNLFITFMIGATDFGYFKIVQRIISIIGMSYYLLSLCVLYQISKINGKTEQIIGLVLLSLAILPLIGVANPFYAFGIYLGVNAYICGVIALLLGVIAYFKLLPLLKVHVRIGLKEHD